MAQALIRNIDDALLDEYRAEARRNGRSLEAELRLVIERSRPLRPKDPETLARLSRRLRAMTPADPGDSTHHIRQDRDDRQKA